jgi:hypothetical protein
LEAALDIDPADQGDRGALCAGGWSIVDPGSVAGSAASYRRYIRESMGEVMIAKNMYVETRGGWFSDRSACYLAAGKPVVAQDTGWTKNHPAGTGLLPFSTLEDATDAIAEVRRNYSHHAAAAREVAESEFDSRHVLERLATRVGG